MQTMNNNKLNCKYSPHFNEERTGKKRKQMEPLGCETIKLRVCQPAACTPSLSDDSSQKQCILFVFFGGSAKIIKLARFRLVGWSCLPGRQPAPDLTYSINKSFSEHSLTHKQAWYCSRTSHPNTSSPVFWISKWARVNTATMHPPKSVRCKLLNALLQLPARLAYVFAVCRSVDSFWIL